MTENVVIWLLSIIFSQDGDDFSFNSLRLACLGNTLCYYLTYYITHQRISVDGQFAYEIANNSLDCYGGES